MDVYSYCDERKSYPILFGIIEDTLTDWVRSILLYDILLIYEIQRRTHSEKFSQN